MKKRICIGIPAYGGIKPKTLFSLLWLVQYSSKDYEFHFVVKEGGSITQNRQLIVNEALNSSCSHILFVDTDMLFGETILEKLIAHDKDIVGVNAMMRQLPLETTVKHDYEEIPNELFKCRAVGTGILLVKTSVFQKIDQPFFNFELNESGLIQTGEDVWFCKQAEAKGIEIWCDPTIEVKHLGEYSY